MFIVLLKCCFMLLSRNHFWPPKGVSVGARFRYSSPGLREKVDAEIEACKLLHIWPFNLQLSAAGGGACLIMQILQMSHSGSLTPCSCCGGAANIFLAAPSAAGP